MRFPALPVAAFLTLSLGAQHAAAAAWPRGEGNGFVSLSYQLQLNDTTDQDYSSLFFEYGLTEKLTFVLDAGYNPLSQGRSAIAALRYPVALGSGPDVFAAELGIGAVDIGDETVALVRPGVSWGRGWQAGFGSGWMGVEATYAIRNDESRLGKIDATLGYNHEGGSLSILQLQTSKPSDAEWSAALAPSYVHAFGNGAFLELGASYKLSNGATSIKLGLWKNF